VQRMGGREWNNALEIMPECYEADVSQRVYTAYGGESSRSKYFKTAVIDMTVDCTVAG
jgi:hypothetical protein